MKNKAAAGKIARAAVEGFKVKGGGKVRGFSPEILTAVVSSRKILNF